MATNKNTNATVGAKISFSQEVNTNPSADFGGINQPVHSTNSQYGMGVNLTSSSGVDKSIKTTKLVGGGTSTSVSLNAGHVIGTFGDTNIVTNFDKLHSVCLHAVFNNDTTGYVNCQVADSTVKLYDTDSATFIWNQGVDATSLALGNSGTGAVNVTVMAIGKGVWATG